jgi:hypothetical protein
MLDDAECLIGFLAKVISSGMLPTKNGRLLRIFSTSYTNILRSYMVDFKEWSLPRPSDINAKYDAWGLFDY